MAESNELDKPLTGLDQTLTLIGALEESELLRPLAERLLRILQDPLLCFTLSQYRSSGDKPPTH